MQTRLLCSLLALTAATPAFADTLTVDPAGAGDATTVQGGIDLASTGDVVEVLPGTYTEDIDFEGRNIVVSSTGGSQVTFLVGSGSGPVVTFDTAETSAAALVGFDISGGDATDVGYEGGCVHVATSSPSLEDLVVHGCVGHLGGGIQLGNSSSTLTNIELYDNEVETDSGGSWAYGGGLYAFDSDITLVSVHSHDNAAERGGGIALGGTSSSMTDCSASSNTAVRAGGISLLGGTHVLDSVVVDQNTASNHSGGIWVSVEAELTLTDSAVTGNAAGEGGGLRVSDAAATVTGTTLSGNEATGTGGGFRVDNESTLTMNDCSVGNNDAQFGGGGLSTEDSVLSIVSSHFDANASSASGGALYLSDSASTVQGCLMTHNSAAQDGGGVRVQDGTLLLTNTILLGNSASNGAGVHLYDGAEGTLSHLSAAGNEASSGGTLRVTGDSSMVLTNSIVALPELGSCLSVPTDATWSIAYNDVFGTAVEWSGGVTDQEGLNGNISEAPQFTNYVADGQYDGDDFTLASTSPCIDAGDPTSPADIDGSLPDLGAFGGPDADLLIDLFTEEEPGDDDDSAGDDDDSAGDDDDSAGDDDDSAGDDDDATGDDDDAAGDDDDATLGDDDDAPPPDDGGCDCGSTTVGSRGAGLSWLLFGLFAVARRRYSSSAHS
ncbi:MAG: right-handed parallel beta-helix repeat-containing protein [Deltaproteobacteria bacterium]|nr:right-handed parallel beta-helix repeat-containing protein [Deltaproteobacteria bacterium]